MKTLKFMKLKSIILAILITINLGVKAEESISSAQAVFIYNFLRHVNWPESATGDKFVIGVLGNSDTYDQLVGFTKDRKIGTKTIVVLKLKTIEESSQCQLVFVPASKKSKISEIKSYIGSKPCLIVSESSGTTSSGSVIEFVVDNNRLKFHIDEANARQQHLTISRALLDMAV
jgi:hypothetical protein